jgi:hypothetical protein
MGPEELLAKAFADRPGEASRIVFRVRSSPLVNKDTSDSSDTDDESGDDSDADNLTAVNPTNWIEYAQLLEQSGKAFPSLAYVNISSNPCPQTLSSNNKNNSISKAQAYLALIIKFIHPHQSSPVKTGFFSVTYIR